MSSSKKILKLLESGLAYHQAGLLEQAETTYRTVLHKQPKNPDALNLLGVIAHQTGRNENAIELIKKAIMNNPGIADYHNNCGEAYRALGNTNLAIKCYEKAISLQPNHANAFNNLGLSFNDLGQFDKAETYFEKALIFSPNDADIHVNLGRSLAKKGQHIDAINSYKKAIKLNPDFTDAYINLGFSLNKLKQHEDAITVYEKALTIHPNNPLIQHALGLSLYEMNRIQDAINHFNQALTADPGNAVTHNSLGIAFKDIGEFEKASKHYEQALVVKPDYAEALYNLVILDPKQKYISLIEEHLTNPKISETDKIIYHYSLGILFEKNKSHDKTFEHYLQANSLKRKTITYNPDNTSTYVDRIISVYSKEYFQRLPEFGLDSELPVFIVGMPRSGTTLVEQIISSHPDVYGAGELMLLTNIEQSINIQTDISCSYPECIPHQDKSTIHNSAKKYLDDLKNYSPNSKRITDKMPDNFLRLGLIKTLLPKAHIIHCQRNPLDTCTSIFLNYFTRGNEYSFDLIELGRLYLDYEKIMAHWRDLFPSDIFEVKYEELIDNQEKISRELIAHIGLDWDDSCLDFYNNKRTVKTVSGLKVRQPLYKSAINKWKNYEKHLGPLKELLKDHI